MSERELRVGSTVGDALSFTVGNFGSIIRIGWFPLVLGAALSIGLMAYYFLPLWPALLEAFQTASDTDAAGKGTVSTNPMDDPFIRMMMEMGPARVTAFYSASILIGLFTYAIPSVVYARMVVTGDTPRGPLYFRLGGRELSVAIVYLVLGVLMYVAMFITMIILLIPFFIVLAVSGAAGTGEPGAGIILLMLALLVPGLLIGLAAPIAKFGLAIPIASVEGGLGLGQAWDMSRGHFWTLVWSLVLAILLLLVFLIAAAIVMMIVAMPFFMAGGAASAATGVGPTLIAMLGVMSVLYLVFYLVSYCFSMAFFTAIFSVAYKRVSGEAPAVNGTEGGAR